ncbi:MAG: hypothetical protein KGY54_10740 [Oleiphilaceae bacterium]|nr:hypothetical protein [Oleiphilaceae bacterium]
MAAPEPYRDVFTGVSGKELAAPVQTPKPAVLSLYEPASTQVRDIIESGSRR